MADYTVKYRIGVDTGGAAENLDRVSKSGEKADKAIKQVGNTAGGGNGSAAYAMTNFNRVVQDMPYGFMGIANNIDPLMTSFQKLKAETGSGSAAFKALLGTLSGPMGMLFAINMLVLAIQVLPGLWQKVSTALGGASAKMKELYNATKAQNVLSNESIVKNTGEALSLLRLRERIDETKRASTERKKIIDQINAISPETLKNIDVNTASEKTLKNAIDGTISALYSKVDAQLTDIFLAPVYKQLADAQLKFSDAQAKATKTQTEYNQAVVAMQTGNLSGTARGSASLQEKLSQALIERDKAATAQQVALAFMLNAVQPDQLTAQMSQKDALLNILLPGVRKPGNAISPSGTGRNNVERIMRPVQDAAELFIQQAEGEWRKWISKVTDGDIQNAEVNYKKTGMLRYLEKVEEKGYDINKMMGKLNESFDEFTGFSEKIERGFDNSFDRLSTGIVDAIWGYERLDLVGQKFLSTLTQMVIQTIILSAIQAGIGALVGPIGLSGWIQKNIFGVEGVGGRSLTNGIGISTGEMNLLRNISRQTLNLGGELKLRASGNELKATLKAEELFRGRNR